MLSLSLKLPAARQCSKKPTAEKLTQPHELKRGRLVDLARFAFAENREKRARTAWKSRKTGGQAEGQVREQK
jgi:hypothetical protein